MVLHQVDTWQKALGQHVRETHWQPSQTCTQRSKAKIKVSLTPSHLRLRTRLLFCGRSRKSMRKSIRAWVSFDVNPWMRPKKVSVSLMVNSLYRARSCQVDKTQTVNTFWPTTLTRQNFATLWRPADKESPTPIHYDYLQWNLGRRKADVNVYYNLSIKHKRFFIRGMLNIGTEKVKK